MPEVDLGHLNFVECRTEETDPLTVSVTINDYYAAQNVAASMINHGVGFVLKVFKGLKTTEWIFEFTPEAIHAVRMSGYFNGME